MLLGLALLVLGCGPPVATPSLFQPPGLDAATSTPAIAPAFTLPPAAQVSITATRAAASLPSPAPPCSDGLHFVQDLNYPDDTTVQPGQRLVKDWLVQNNGSCDWNDRYRLELTGGIDLGTDGVQALYPARAGTQADLQITFTAPDLPGTYRSEWHAQAPGGESFGDALYIEIVVTP